MKYYAKVNGGLVSYEGMSIDTITAMLAEQSIVPEFIDEEEYKTELAALEIK
jgi:hypothetical protein